MYHYFLELLPLFIGQSQLCNEVYCTLVTHKAAGLGMHVTGFTLLFYFSLLIEINWLALLEQMLFLTFIFRVDCCAFGEQ